MTASKRTAAVGEQPGVRIGWARTVTTPPIAGPTLVSGRAADHPEGPDTSASRSGAYTRSEDAKAKARATLAQRRLQFDVAAAKRTSDTGYRPGDKVRTNCPKSPRYHNRVGTVTGSHQGEVGISFTVHQKMEDTYAVPAAWFLPNELTTVRIYSD